MEEYREREVLCACNPKVTGLIRRLGGKGGMGNRDGGWGNEEWRRRRWGKREEIEEHLGRRGSFWEECLAAARKMTNRRRRSNDRQTVWLRKKFIKAEETKSLSLGELVSVPALIFPHKYRR